MSQAQANNVAITDTIPNGTVYVAGSATGGGTYDGTRITWIIPSLAAGNSGTVFFKTTIE